MVFYNKKEVSLEGAPICVRLERRHTMAEGGQGMDRSRTSRTNSVSGMSTRTKSIESLEKESKARSSLSEDRRNTFSVASTVVITESELSSSWLYNSQKAHVNANHRNGISPDSKSQVTSSSLENLLPEAHPDPFVRDAPYPMESHSGRRSSCCCYVIIVAVIFFASLGILAAIGGIVYMELFAAQEIKDNSNTGNSNNTDILVQKLSNESEEKLSILLPIQVTNGEPSEKIPSVTPKDSRTESDGNVKSIHHKLVEESQLNMTENTNATNSLANKMESSSSSSENAHQSLDSSNTSENIKIILSNILPPLEVTSDIPNPDKFELPIEFEDGLHKRLLIIGDQNTNLSTAHTSQNVSEAEDNSAMKEQEEINTLNSNTGNEIQEELNSEDGMSPDSKQQPPSNFDNQENNFDYVNTEEIPKEVLNFSLLPSLDFTSIVPLDTQRQILETFSESIDQDDATDEIINSIVPIDTQRQSLEAFSESIEQANATDEIINSDGQNESSSDSDFDRLSPMNRTVDDSNALPLEFFRRLGFDQEYILNHPALTVEDMNVKFSLSEALKYLRALDVNTKHPTARQKTVTQSTKNRSGRKMDVDVVKERQGYLQKLRKKIFD